MGFGVSPFAECSLDGALGLAACSWRASVAEGKRLVAAPIVCHDARAGDAGVFVIRPQPPLRKGAALSVVSSGLILEKAARERSSMQTWTKCQLARRPLLG